MTGQSGDETAPEENRLEYLKNFLSRVEGSPTPTVTTEAAASGLPGQHISMQDIRAAINALNQQPVNFIAISELQHVLGLLGVTSSRPGGNTHPRGQSTRDIAASGSIGKLDELLQSHKAAIV